LSANDILNRLHAIRAGEELDWNAIRNEVVTSYRSTHDDAERTTLLQIYKSVMDTVERGGGLSPDDLDAFRHSRREEYNLMLISTCVAEDGNVSPEALRAVTEREVAAGRMAPDDELRMVAIGGPEAFATTAQPPSPKPRFSIFGLGRKRS